MGLQGLIRLIRPGKLQIPGKDLIRLIRFEIQGILRKGLIRLIRVEIQGIPRKGLIRLIRFGKSRNYGNQGVDSIAGGTARISETRELTQSQEESREFRKPGSSLNRKVNRGNFGNQGVHSFLQGIPRKGLIRLIRPGKLQIPGRA